MATPTEQVDERNEEVDPQGLQPSDLLSMYRTMYLSRRMDDRELLMKRQQKIFFQISGAGHEAIGVAAGMALRPGYDWFFTYYRDRALALQLGVTPYEMFLEFHDDEVVLVTTGDGTTSEGEFWESLNTASNLKLPVIYLVEDNGYAISVPVEVNTAGGSISKLVSGFPDLLVIEVDGTNPIASYGAMRRATAHCRERRGPALVHAHVTRPYSHSMSDDERMYKPEVERQKEESRDPIGNMAAFLLSAGVATEEDLEALRTIS